MNLSFLHTPPLPPLLQVKKKKKTNLVLGWLSVPVKDLICDFLPPLPGKEHFSLIH